MSSDPWDVAGGFEPEPEEGIQTGINYDTTNYSTEEAETLVGLLGSPEFALLDKWLEDVRAESVQIMDSGAVTMASAETIVRHSAMRGIITRVRAMKDSLQEDLKKQAESVLVDSKP